MSHIKFHHYSKQVLISEKGASLYFAIIILSILLAMTLALGTILIGQTRMIREMGDSVIAFYAADSGIERILYEDKLCRLDCSGSLRCRDPVECDEGLRAGNFNSSVGSATYRVEFNTGATSITSRGIYLETRRAIEVTR